MTVGFPLYEGFDTLDVLGPLQACTYADLNCVLASSDGCPVKSLEGVTVQVDTDFDGAGQWDILWVPGGADLVQFTPADSQQSHAREAGRGPYAERTGFLPPLPPGEGRGEGQRAAEAPGRSPSP